MFPSQGHRRWQRKQIFVVVDGHDSSFSDESGGYTLTVSEVEDCPQKDCNGKTCGDDGCGGSCGSCPAGDTCLANGTCVCTPDCEGKICGDDGCGGSCGGCINGGQCVWGQVCHCPAGCYGNWVRDDDCELIANCGTFGLSCVVDPDSGQGVCLP